MSRATVLLPSCPDWANDTASLARATIQHLHAQGYAARLIAPPSLWESAPADSFRPVCEPYELTGPLPDCDINQVLPDREPVCITVEDIVGLQSSPALLHSLIASRREFLLSALGVSDSKPASVEFRDQLRAVVGAASQVLLWSVTQHRTLERFIASHIGNVSLLSPIETDPDGTIAGHSEGELRVLCLAPADPVAFGQDLLLEVFRGTVWQSRDWRLTLCAEGPGAEYLRSLSMAFGIADRVELVPATTGDNRLIGDHHILVNVARGDVCSPGLLRAMRAARPIVVVEGTANASFVQDGVTGFIARSATINGISEALENVWSLRSELPVLGEHAQEKAMEYFRPAGSHTTGDAPQKPITGPSVEAGNAIAREIDAAMKAPDQLALAIADAVAPFTMTPRERVVNTLSATDSVITRGIEGAFVECGVWRGGNSMAMALRMLQHRQGTRELYLYDTFDGMSEPTEKDVDPSGESALSLLKDQPKSLENHYWAYSPQEHVEAHLKSTGYPPHLLHFIKGKVEDTIPGVLPDKIALLRLDTDWYESTRHELLHMYARLVPGGVLIIDDYGFWRGAREAVEEFFGAMPISPDIIPILDSVDSCAAFLVKPV